MATSAGLFDGLRSFGARFRRNVAPTEEVGSSSAYTQGGHLVSSEQNPALRGDARYRTYSDLLSNVAIVAAGTRFFLNLVAKSDWTLRPAELETDADNERAQEVADFVEEVLDDLERPWSRVVRRDAMYRFYGFSVSEWTAKRRDDDQIGLLDVAPRPQATITRWDLDEAGRVQGCVQELQRNLQEVYLPRNKIVYIVDDALSDSPEGLGLFRHLVDSNQRMDRYQLLEAFGFETDLKGIPIGRAPYSKLASLVDQGRLSQEKMDLIVKPLEDFIGSHIKNPELGFSMDSAPYRDNGESQAPGSALEWDLSLLQGSPAGAAEVAAAIERITRDMALILGVQGLLLGGDGSGSMALGRVFADQFAQIIDSALRELAQAYEHDLIPVILRLNGIDEEFAPSFETEQVQHRDVEQITQSLLDLSSSGAMLSPDDPAINSIRSLLGLPLVDLEAVTDDLDVPEPPLRPGQPDPEPPDPDDPEDDADDSDDES